MKINICFCYNIKCKLKECQLPFTYRVAKCLLDLFFSSHLYCFKYEILSIEFKCLGLFKLTLISYKLGVKGILEFICNPHFGMTIS